MAYRKIISEEISLVNKAVGLEIEELKSGKMKNYRLTELKKTYLSGPSSR